MRRVSRGHFWIGRGGGCVCEVVWGWFVESGWGAEKQWEVTEQETEGRKGKQVTR